MKLRSRLNLAVLTLFAVLALAVAIVTARWVGALVFESATERVQLSIGSAWLVYDQHVQRIALTAEGVARQLSARLSPEELVSLRDAEDLHVLNVIDPAGYVIRRTTPPYHSGDNLASDPLFLRALHSGQTVTGTLLLDAERLAREGDGLLQRCLANGGEATGMLVAAIAPVRADGRITSYVMAGTLLNGDTGIVDRIRDLLFPEQTYGGKPLGTATVFMGDLRITTNVTRDTTGTRAIGTRVSREVAARVLEEGEPWTGRAWVVDAWYLSQYDPIRDPAGRIIGMLYLGELEQRYVDLRQETIVAYLTIILAVAAFGLVAAFLLSRRVLRPVEQLAEGTRRLAEGDLDHRLADPLHDDELGDLTRDFNAMAAQLTEDHGALETANEELRSTNRSYMEMLGFVSHELRNPLASSVMSLNTVREGYRGPLTDSQRTALDSVDRNLRYFLEMIGNYLDLSRLEKGELRVTPTTLSLRRDVVLPVADGLTGEMTARGMRCTDEVPDDLMLKADGNLIRIVCDNLLANAVKYGREGGAIAIGAREETTDGMEGVTIYVTNEGAGIPPDKIPLLFRKFGRLDDPRTRSTKGTGLGLYVCKEIVEKHGGRIWAESEDGAWARFSFWIPQSAARANDQDGFDVRRQDGRAISSA